MINKKCPSCGETFGVSDSMDEMNKLSGKFWQCPYCGESRQYVPEVVEKARRDAVDIITRRYSNLGFSYRDRGQVVERLMLSNASLRGWVTRLKKQVANLTAALEADIERNG